MITINPEKLVRNATSSGELIFRGGLKLQAELGAQNVQRFANFLTTPQGKTFLLQQTILQSQNPLRDKDTGKRTTAIYNPLAPTLAKGLSQEFTKRKPKRHLDIGDGSLRGVFRGIVGKGSPRTKQEGPVRFFNKGNPSQTMDLQVRYGGEKNDLDIFPDRDNPAGINKPQDFIKFRIRDAVNGKYIIFPALISGITDNSGTTNSSFSYIGRADKVHVYGGYERSISFTVQIVAQRKADIDIIWEKINYAKGLVLPQYKQFFNKDDVSDNTRPVAPIVYLTLGDMFNNAPGFFTAVNLSIPENSTWELEEGRQVPHLCTLAFEFTYIGKQNPTMTSAHYDNIGKKFGMGDPNGEENPVEKFNTKVQRDVRQSKRDIAKAKTDQQALDKLSFGEAFKTKSSQLGPNKTFTWRGKSYSTNKAD